MAETVTASVARMIPTTTRPPVRRWRNAPAATTTPVPIAATASAIVHGTSVPVASSSASAPAAASRRPNTGQEERGLPGRADLGARLGRRLAVVPAPLRDHDRGAAEQEQRPREAAVRPEVGLRDERDDGDRHEGDAGQEPGAVPMTPQRLGGDRVGAALVGDDERCGDVDQDSGPADERQDHEGDPEERGGQVEVAPEPSRDAGEDSILSAAVELFDGRGGGFGGGHLCLSWGTIPGCAPPRRCTIRHAPEPTLIFARPGGTGNPRYTGLNIRGRPGFDVVGSPAELQAEVPEAS